MTTLKRALLIISAILVISKCDDFFDHTPPEIDYSDGRDQFFDTTENEGGILQEETVSVLPNVRMIIPKKIKEIDARQMKNVRGDHEMMMMVKDRSNYTNLADVLNFYNTAMLIRSYDEVKGSIEGNCQKDLEEYFDGLRDGSSWALKMDDSNGRYTSGFFWGNNYWTGSQTQCLKLQPDTPIPSSATEKPSLVSIAARLVQSREDARSNRVRRDNSNKISPSLIMGYQHGKLIHESLPNFTPSFYTLRIHLNTTSAMVTPKLRTIHLGLCMPFSCSNDDIETIVMQVSASHTDQVKIMISDIRSQHRYYNMFEDKLFWLLACVSAIVGILLITGTAYDYYLIDLAKKKKQLSMNCTTYDLTKSEHQLEKHITLDLAKSGRYVVNNSESDENLKENIEVETCSSGVTSDILLAFSIRMNLAVICDKTVGPDTIPTIHGLRALSMAWVILGHTCIIAFKYADNMEYRKVVEAEFTFQTVTNGVYSVDTFFFISGLLVAFLYFRSNAKGTLDHFTKGATKFQAGLLHFCGLIFYRFARLTAPYMFTIGIVTLCMKWYNYNAVFEPPAQDHVNCVNYWWRNILYINTLWPLDQMCMLWSWYLADDTQFYIIGIICLIVALSHFKTAVTMALSLMIGSWLITTYVAYTNNHIPNLDDPLALFDKIYDKPWTRFGPYLIGMGTGYLLFKTDCRIRMSKVTCTVGWILSISCLLFLIYGLYDVELSRYSAAAFSALSHSFWAFSCAWIVIACSTGYGGIASTVLSARVLYPFSRVTYCAYLIHPLCIRYMIMQMDSPLHLGKELMATVYLGQIVLSYALSFVLSLAFEAPVVALLRIMSPTKNKKRL